MICGFAKTSLVDYPGKLCSTIFIGGCNFRCPYCHNPSIVLSKEREIPIEIVLDFLKKRKGIIEAVCITGGEPTLDSSLPGLIDQFKELGLLVKLDTNGTAPLVLESLVKSKSVDYIAMDVKAPLEKYPEIVRGSMDENILKDAVQKSVSLVLSFQMHEFRTTVHSQLLTRDDILSIARLIKGAQRFVLQEFKHSSDLIDNSFSNSNTTTHMDLESFRKEIQSMNLIKEVIVR